MCGGVVVPPFVVNPSTDGGSTAGNATDGGALPSAVVMVAGVVASPLPVASPPRRIRFCTPRFSGLRLKRERNE